jgi:CSLREA domain-containing protein
METPVMNRLIQSLLSGLLLTALIGPANASVTFTVNNVADSVDINPGDGVCRDFHGQCSLRAAVMEANALSGADVIGFDPSIDGQVIRLQLHGAGENMAATGDLDITDDLTIIGNGETKTLIDGDAADRVFQVLNHTLTLKQLTVQNGGGVDWGAGIQVNNSGTLDLDSVHVTDNHAIGDDVLGGGIEVNGGFGAQGSTISNNSATSSGGAANGGGLAVYYTHLYEA